MKYIPYQIVAVMSLVVAFFVGALLQAGAQYLNEIAYLNGQLSILADMPIESLSTIDVKERDI